MNKRLLELAEQCDTGMTFNMSKFAELIVRECIQICEQMHETPNGKMRCGNDDASVRIIKERFGVE
jgi:hypothetical protein